MDAEERVKQLRAELEALAATIEQVSSQARRAPPQQDDVSRISETWFDSAAWILLVVGW